jgi:hypothetical protein
MSSLVLTFVDPEGGEAAFRDWFDTSQSRAAAKLPGFETALCVALDEIQILPDQPRPSRMAMLHWFDAPADTVPLVYLEAIFAAGGTIKAFASHMFDCVAPWRLAEGASLGSLTHLTIVMGNAAPGRDADYNRWYDEQHTPDVIATPEVAGMWRGRLAAKQMRPAQPQPAGYVVLVAASTGDARAMLGEMAARTMGTSASGIRHAPRSDAVSNERTIHFFRKV